MKPVKIWDRRWQKYLREFREAASSQHLKVQTGIDVEKDREGFPNMMEGTQDEVQIQ